MSHKLFEDTMNNSTFMLRVAQGLIPGISHINKFGQNIDIDTGTDPEDIWDIGGLWVAPTAARTHDIVSTDTNDTSVGTGVRTVMIEGLSATWVEQSETITMNGTTNVATANTYHRIHKMYAITAGSSMINAGSITATAQTDTTVTAQISIGEGQTKMAIYTVPAGKTAYMTHIYSSMNRSTTAGARSELVLCHVPNVDTANPAARISYTWGNALDGSSLVNHNFLPYKVFTEKTDIIVRCVEVSASNINISAGFDLILVDN